MGDTPTPLTAFQHALGIMARWPGTVRIVQHRVADGTIDMLSWTGELQPTVFSATYTLSFQYADGDYTPDVQVLDPELDPGIARDLPHVYTDTGGLCLHLRNQWDPSQPIATTIVPWAAEWLLHYELWKATGEWTGGGHPHLEPVRPIDGRRIRRATA